MNDNGLLEMDTMSSKHIDVLRSGMIESEIKGSDLPDITSSDLSSPPFNIKQFRDKKDLVKHFMSLLNINGNEPMAIAVQANEGAMTAYIQ